MSFDRGGKFSNIEIAMFYVIVLALAGMAIITWNIETSAKEKVGVCTNQWRYWEDIYEIPLSPQTDAELLGTYISKQYRTNLNSTIQIVEVAEAYTIDTGFPDLLTVLSIIAVESSFNVNAVSRIGALGLMQVRPMNSPGETFEDNIVAGIYLLQTYKMELGADTDTIMAYNVGNNGFRKGRRNFKYVRDVLTKYAEFNKVLESKWL